MLDEWRFSMSHAEAFLPWLSSFAFCTADACLLWTPGVGWWRAWTCVNRSSVFYKALQEVDSYAWRCALLFWGGLGMIILGIVWLVFTFAVDIQKAWHGWRGKHSEKILKERSSIRRKRSVSVSRKPSKSARKQSYGPLSRENTSFFDTLFFQGLSIQHRLSIFVLFVSFWAGLCLYMSHMVTKELIPALSKPHALGIRGESPDTLVGFYYNAGTFPYVRKLSAHLNPKIASEAVSSVLSLLPEWHMRWAFGMPEFMLGRNALFGNHLPAEHKEALALLMRNRFGDLYSHIGALLGDLGYRGVQISESLPPPHFVVFLPHSMWEEPAGWIHAESREGASNSRRAGSSFVVPLTPVKRCLLYIFEQNENSGKSERVPGTVISKRTEELQYGQMILYGDSTLVQLGPCQSATESTTLFLWGRLKWDEQSQQWEMYG